MSQTDGLQLTDTTSSTHGHLDGKASQSSLIRKRKRSDSTEVEQQPEQMEASSSDSMLVSEEEDVNLQLKSMKSIVRDESYYLEDGSCILLVHDTLFNVHRSILSKDGSSFGTMFSLPQGRGEVEGTSDDNPIVLRGDTVSEFRHFLWALYALPPELRLINSPGTDLTQLIDIARISNKYSFKSLETWALDAIQEYVNHRPSPILNAIPAPHAYTFSVHSAPTQLSGENIESTAQLTRLIRLAQLCNHEHLLSTMIALLRQLMSSSLQYAYLAMTLADELDLRALRGAAYLEVMQKAVVVKRGKFDLPRTPAPPVVANTLAAAAAPGAGAVPAATPQPAQPSGSNEGDVDEDGRLIITPAQQLRLLSGYYRLTRTWERLRIAPPQFDHAPSCSATWHQHGCTQSWLEFWKDKTRSDPVLTLGMADVLGRLRQVSKDYDRWGSATYMHHDCRLAARRSMAEMIKSVEDALPDYFSEGGDEG